MNSLIGALSIIFTTTAASYIAPVASIIQGISRIATNDNGYSQLVYTNPVVTKSEYVAPIYREPVATYVSTVTNYISPVADYARFVDKYAPATGPLEKSDASYNSHVVNTKVAVKYAAQVAKPARSPTPVDSYGNPLRAEDLDYGNHYVGDNFERLYDDGSYKEDFNEKLYDDGSYKERRTYW